METMNSNVKEPYKPPLVFDIRPVTFVDGISGDSTDLDDDDTEDD